MSTSDLLESVDKLESVRTCPPARAPSQSDHRTFLCFPPLDFLSFLQQRPLLPSPLPPPLLCLFCRSSFLLCLTLQFILGLFALFLVRGRSFRCDRAEEVGSTFGQRDVR